MKLFSKMRLIFREILGSSDSFEETALFLDFLKILELEDSLATILIHENIIVFKYFSYSLIKKIGEKLEKDLNIKIQNCVSYKFLSEYMRVNSVRAIITFEDIEFPELSDVKILRYQLPLSKFDEIDIKNQLLSK